MHASPLSVSQWQELVHLLSLSLCRDKRARDSGNSRTVKWFAWFTRERTAILLNTLFQLAAAVLSFYSQYVTAGILGAVIDGDAARAWRGVIQSIAFYATYGIVLAVNSRVAEEIRISARYQLTRYMHVLYFQQRVPFWLSRGLGPASAMAKASSLPIDSPDQRITQDVDDFTQELCGVLFGSYTNPNAGVLGTLASVIITASAVTSLSPIPAGIGILFVVVVTSGLALLAHWVSLTYFKADAAMGRLRGHYATLSSSTEQVLLLRGEAAERTTGAILLAKYYWSALRWFGVAALQAAFSGFVAGYPYILALITCLVLAQQMGPGSINEFGGPTSAGSVVDATALSLASAVIYAYIQSLVTLPSLWSSFAQLSGVVARVGLAVEALETVNGGRKEADAIACRHLDWQPTHAGSVPWPWCACVCRRAGVGVATERTALTATHADNDAVTAMPFTSSDAATESSVWASSTPASGMAPGAADILDRIRGWLTTDSEGLPASDSPHPRVLRLLAPSGTGKTSCTRVMVGLWRDPATEQSGAQDTPSSNSRLVFLPQKAYAKPGAIDAAVIPDTRAPKWGHDSDMCPAAEELQDAVRTLASTYNVASSAQKEFSNTLHTFAHVGAYHSVPIGAWMQSCACLLRPLSFLSRLRSCFPPSRMQQQGEHSRNLLTDVHVSYDATSLSPTSSTAEAALRQVGLLHLLHRGTHTLVVQAQEEAGKEAVQPQTQSRVHAAAVGDWPKVVSGGELQRLQLARALCRLRDYSDATTSTASTTNAGPVVVVVDEAFASLDDAAAAYLFNVLQREASAAHASIVLLTTQDDEGEAVHQDSIEADAVLPSSFLLPVSPREETKDPSPSPSLPPSPVPLHRILATLFNAQASILCRSSDSFIYRCCDPGSRIYVAVIAVLAAAGCIASALITVAVANTPGEIVSAILDSDWAAAWAAVRFATFLYVLSPCMGAVSRGVGRALSLALFTRLVHTNGSALTTRAGLIALLLPAPANHQSLSSSSSSSITSTSSSRGNQSRLDSVDQRVVADTWSLATDLGTVCFGGDGRLPLLQVLATIIATSARIISMGQTVWVLVCALVYALAGIMLTRCFAGKIPSATALVSAAEGVLRAVHVRVCTYCESICLQAGEASEGRDAETALICVVTTSLSAVRVTFPARLLNALFANCSLAAAYGFAALLCLVGAGGRDASNVYSLAMLLSSLLMYCAALPDYYTVSRELVGYAARVGVLMGALQSLPHQSEVHIQANTPADRDAGPMTMGPIVANAGCSAFTATIPACDPGSGQLFVVAAPSGSGKTTAMRILAGLWPNHASDTIPFTNKATLSGAMFLPQNKFVPGAPATLADCVRYPLPPPALDADLRRVTSALDAVGLLVPATAAVTRVLVSQGESTDASSVPLTAHQTLTTTCMDWRSCLSGGEMARLALARVLYHCPRWVIADEPFVGLDAAAVSTCKAALMQAGVRMIAFETT